MKNFFEKAVLFVIKLAINKVLYKSASKREKKIKEVLIQYIDENNMQIYLCMKNFRFKAIIKTSGEALANKARELYDFPILFEREINELFVEKLDITRDESNFSCSGITINCRDDNEVRYLIYTFVCLVLEHKYPNATRSEFIKNPNSKRDSHGKILFQEPLSHKTYDVNGKLVDIDRNFWIRGAAHHNGFVILDSEKGFHIEASKAEDEDDVYCDRNRYYEVLGSMW